jgi:hypothetical protein
VTWAINERGYSQRRACRLVGLLAKTCRYCQPDLTIVRRGLRCAPGPTRKPYQCQVTEYRLERVRAMSCSKGRVTTETTATPQKLQSGNGL